MRHVYKDIQKIVQIGDSNWKWKFRYYIVIYIFIKKRFPKHMLYVFSFLTIIQFVQSGESFNFTNSAFYDAEHKNCDGYIQG